MTTTYGNAALQGELRKLRNAAPKDRNNQLFRSAAALAELFGPGALDEHETSVELTRVALAVGQTSAEARQTIASGFKRGTRKPRAISVDQREAPPSSRPAAEVRDPAAGRYPPVHDVTALWNACGPVIDSSTCSTWLRRHRIDPVSVADMDLARALPVSGDLPKFAYVGTQSWRATGHLLIVPMFDTMGSMRSLIARSVTGATPKSVAPAKYERGGLVLACALGRQILARKAWPAWWEASQTRRIEVAEGEKKYLLRATTLGDANEFSPAVIGVESGAWTPDVAAGVPDGSTIVVMTDPDEAGAKYATKIVQSLGKRITSGAVEVELRPEFALGRGLIVTVQS